MNRHICVHLLLIEIDHLAPVKRWTPEVHSFHFTKAGKLTDYKAAFVIMNEVIICLLCSTWERKKELQKKNPIRELNSTVLIDETF